ncbi:MAG: four helix bundle protein [bacterium (Candidatus Stahlbacteria) CG23_combo_of_CG06-09_8_20_14_all_40_9]|nr:MAG: four helix bundle protein [bacterium (Candidatus Stahlbacteria) CG23_combo_of_CG06-09_8_20_14_all_40_9]
MQILEPDPMTLQKLFFRNSQRLFRNLLVMTKKELEKRTKEFALRMIRFVSNLPKNKVTDVLGYQLLKAGTSVGANYREANRAESHNDFIHKIGIVEKESSESEYWLELFDEAEIGDQDERHWLLNEVGEFVKIFTSIGKTAKQRR